MTKTTTTIATADTEAVTVSREVPKIDPGQVRLDVSGHHHQRYAVTLPAGCFVDSPTLAINNARLSSVLSGEWQVGVSSHGGP